MSNVKENINIIYKYLENTYKINQSISAGLVNKKQLVNININHSESGDFVYSSDWISMDYTEGYLANQRNVGKRRMYLNFEIVLLNIPNIYLSNIKGEVIIRGGVSEKLDNSVVVNRSTAFRYLRYLSPTDNALLCMITFSILRKDLVETFQDIQLTSSHLFLPQYEGKLLLNIKKGTAIV